MALDDFPRELYAEILPDKTAGSVATFLADVIAQRPYQYSEDGKEFKATAGCAFVKACRQHGIGQKFARVIAVSEIESGLMRPG